MIRIEQALAAVLEHATRKPAARVPLDESVGLVLAQDITSDVDSPPFDKSLVDGYAVVAGDVRAETTDLLVLEQLTAGALPTKSVQPGTTTQIMTGAPIPAGADAVVMVEHTSPLAADASSQQRVRIGQREISAGTNVMQRGASLSCGQVVLRAGTVLRPAEVGLLAEVGQAEVPVYRSATVAVLPTGNELVPAHHTPAKGQIRNSNGPMLMALARQVGARPVSPGVARDEPHALGQLIQRGLREDVLVIAGGVSAGVHDLVPRVLQELGVQQVFHRVHLKPGKPLWFGVWPRPGAEEAGPAADGKRGTTLVFGLPGNPVGSLVCFELFVRPALEQLAGRPVPGLVRQRARLLGDYQHDDERPLFAPAVVRPTHERPGAAAQRSAGSSPADANTLHTGSISSEPLPMVEPLPWQGSADLRALTDANCLALFPVGQRSYRAGEIVECFLLSSFPRTFFFPRMARQYHG